MIIPGYLDGFAPAIAESPLVDAMEMLDDPAFWPAFLWAVGGAESAVYAFDADPADVEKNLTELVRPDRWPMFTVPVAGGHRVHVVLRNFVEDAGVDYVLAPAGSGPVIRLAALEGCFRGPALCWTELVGTAQQADPDLDPAVRLLLLLPAATGDADLPANARALVAAAVAAVGGTRQPEQVAAELLDDKRHWEPCSWVVTAGVRTCLGEYSYRTPAAAPADLRLLTGAFGG